MMLKSIVLVAGLLAGKAALPQEGDLTQAPPPAPAQAVSNLVELPEFLPGLGQLFADPATLSFLAYDHDSKLSAAVYKRYGLQRHCRGRPDRVGSGHLLQRRSPRGGGAARARRAGLASYSDGPSSRREPSEKRESRKRRRS